MAWQTVASGDSTSTPDVALTPGVKYRFTLTAPFEVQLPAWLADSIWSALTGLGLHVSTVTVAGSSATIEFTA